MTRWFDSKPSIREHLSFLADTAAAVALLEALVERVSHGSEENGVVTLHLPPEHVLLFGPPPSEEDRASLPRGVVPILERHAAVQLWEGENVLCVQVAVDSSTVPSNAFDGTAWADAGYDLDRAVRVVDGWIVDMENVRASDGGPVFRELSENTLGDRVDVGAGTLFLHELCKRLGIAVPALSTWKPRDDALTAVEPPRPQPIGDLSVDEVMRVKALLVADPLLMDVHDLAKKGRAEAREIYDLVERYQAGLGDEARSKFLFNHGFGVSELGKALGKG
jgi:hypothetical protein